MPHGKQLTEEEVREVWYLHGAGWSQRKIAAKIGRSKHAVQLVIKHGISGTTIKRPG